VTQCVASSSVTSPATCLQSPTFSVDDEMDADFAHLTLDDEIDADFAHLT